MNDKTYHAADRVGITSRIVTSEGYLVVPGTLARTGVQEYRAFDLGLDADGIDPMRVIRLHRPAEEVFTPDSLKSFENKPVTVEHPDEEVTAANWKEHAVGEVRDVQRSGDLMSGIVIIKDASAIEAMQSGKVELSNGYAFNLDMTPGQTHDGKPYDGVQRNIRGNHVAVVDAARCGSACRIADSQPSLNPKGNAMADEAKRKVTVDGIPLEVSDTAAAAIDKLMKERGDANAAKDAAEKRLQLKVGDKTLTPEEAVKLIGDMQTQIDALKKDVVTPEQRDAMVADWSKLIGDAKRLAPEVVTDGKTCLAIRREVVAAIAAKDATAKAVADAVLAGKKLDTADADAVRATFQAVAAAVKTEANDHAAQANDAAVAAALTGESKGGNGGAEAQPELSGRDAFLARQTQAWMKKPGQ